MLRQRLYRRRALSVGDDVVKAQALGIAVYALIRMVVYDGFSFKSTFEITRSTRAPALS